MHTNYVVTNNCTGIFFYRIALSWDVEFDSDATPACIRNTSHMRIYDRIGDNNIVLLDYFT